MQTEKSIKKNTKSAKIGRPIKTRLVRKELRTKQFSPRGHIGRPGYKVLKFEEIESIRLADYMGLNQREAARFMGISQQTFSRILRKCRKTLAEALVNGEIIKVQGGDFKIEKKV